MMVKKRPPNEEKCRRVEHKETACVGAGSGRPDGAVTEINAIRGTIEKDRGETESINQPNKKTRAIQNGASVRQRNVRNGFVGNHHDDATWPSKRTRARNKQDSSISLYVWDVD